MVDVADAADVERILKLFIPVPLKLFKSYLNPIFPTCNYCKVFKVNVS
jgi:hypothetical protein